MSTVNKKPVATVSNKTEDTAKLTPIEKALEKTTEVKNDVKKEVKEVKKEVKKAAKPVAKKAAAAKKSATTAAKTAVKAVKAPKEKKTESKVTLQFSGKNYSTEDLLNIAKDVWVYDYGKKAEELKEVELYVKPEEYKVYYIFNKEFAGDFMI